MFLARYLESRFHFTAPYLACELLLVGISASFSLLFVVPKLQKSLGDLTLMRLGMVANTISVALFGIIWQPWQVGEIIIKKSCWEQWHFTFSWSKSKIQQQYIQHPFLNFTQISKTSKPSSPFSSFFFSKPHFPPVVSRRSFHPWVASWPLPYFPPPTPWLLPRHPRRWPRHKGWSQGHGPWPKECHQCCLEVGRHTCKVTMIFFGEVMELERSERSETSTYIPFLTSILPWFFLCRCHVERSNWKLWNWMSRLRRCTFLETASHWEFKHAANQVQLSVGWSLMAKLFVAA